MVVTLTNYTDMVAEERVHRRVYVDPDVFEEEIRRIFGRTWICVGHDSQVPKPGDFVTMTMARKPLIMVRGEDGRVRVFYNVCRHRGAKVCYEPAGSTTRFRCMYHGWTYGTSGHLIGVPLQERFRGCEWEDLGLIPVARVGIYRGFVFISQGAEGLSLEEYLGRGCYYLDLMCERAPEGEIVATHPVKYYFNGNWKLQLENYSDNYHPPILHQSSLEIGRKMLARKYGTSLFTMQRAASGYVERAFGEGHGMCDYAGSRGSIWLNAYENEAYLRALEHRHGVERARELLELDIHVMIYPNLLLHSRMNHFRLINPITVDYTEIYTYPCKLKGAPEDVNEKLVLNTSHHVSAMGEVQVDDMQSFNWVQEGLQVEEMEWVLMGLHGENEHINEYGELEWYGASEGILRNQYRQWKKLMSM
jgi:benzoate/toluate 1,2-dioxygenase alpha subunit